MKINRKSKEGINKKIALISLVALFFNATMLGVFAPSKSLLQAVDENLCAVDVDVVLVMDRSGSMGEGGALSRCDWWVIEEQLGGGYGWSFKTDYDVTQDWCDSKSEPPSRLSTFTPATNSKITDAKSAANTFLGYLKTNDQSALVSFADTASLDKQLSNDHGATQIAVDSLTAGGDTNIGDAIVEGIAELSSEERANPQAVKIMILLTDGVANMPDGAGDPDPEVYAKEKAFDAAALGYKIFTIGLGADVNGTMLQDIADTTQADYYPAPTSAQLESIYDSIRLQICKYGSISGCKYSDMDPNDVGITGDLKIEDWPIILTDRANGPITQLTDQNGCYSFTGLSSGTYTISEGIKIGVENFEQTYPIDDSYIDVSLGEEENKVDYDFGNYLPVCGNGILDENYYSYNEECDDGNDIDNDDCSNECTTNIIIPDCGNGILDDDEECDFGINNGQIGSACNGSCQWFEPAKGCSEPLILEDVDPIDGVDVGNLDDEDGHNLIGWSSANIVGNYGGCYADPTCFYRQIIEETGCNNDSRSASFTLEAGENYATSFGIRHLDGMSNFDSFDIYVNDIFLAHYADENIISEDWHTHNYPLDNLIGTLNIELIATDEIWGSCSAYGQVAIDWVEISGYECLSQGTDCGNGILEEPEQCDDGEDNGNGVYCSSQCTINPECNNGIDDDDDWYVDEADIGCEDAYGYYDPTDDDESNPFCGDGTCDNNETCSTCPDDCGSCEQDPYCGDGICNNDETCSICPGDCGSCGGGSSVITKPLIIITNEAVAYLGGGVAKVTWTTNIETTRQVAYGDDSISTLGIAPEYGYDSVNTESTNMTKGHSVTISGLIDGISYYFRPVADRSGSTGEVVGIEVSYKIGEIKGVTDPPDPIPTPIPIECNYLLEYIKLGADNDPVEVEKLERFLNEFEGEGLEVNGIYEQVDFDAVSRFQEKYLENVLSPWSHNKATGYVYITTKKKINELYCEREFPLTGEQEAEILRMSSMFKLSLESAEESTEGGVFDSESDFEESMSESESKPGEVAGAKDETEAEEELPEEPEEPEDEEEKIEKPADDGVLLVDNGEEDEEQEDGSAVKAFGGLGSWLWVVAVILIGVIAYSFSSIAKRKKKE